MLARTLLTRLSTLQSCQSALSKQSMVIPYTCRTTSIVRQISCTVCKFEDTDGEEGKKKSRYTTDPGKEGMNYYIPRKVDVEDSIRYMESEAYKDVYGDDPVWVPYRKNTKGSFYPKLRKTCIRSGAIATGSACPVCRDDYLVLDYRNVKLLKQFVYDATLKPRSERQTGLCNKQLKKLQLEVAKAQDYGYLEKYFPFRHYDYSMKKSEIKKSSDDNSSEQTKEQGTSDTKSIAIGQAVAVDETL